ncbi:hypothetical protein V499_01905 [Pseudogymnoascus sp. VKM F-103]|nr:hypothetical protein V499_01905 [Pseudogymnoascus sp. VKM F-103]
MLPTGAGNPHRSRHYHCHGDSSGLGSWGGGNDANDPTSADEAASYDFRLGGGLGGNYRPGREEEKAESDKPAALHKVSETKTKGVGNRTPKSKPDDDDFKADSPGTNLVVTKLPKEDPALEIVKQHDPPDFQWPTSVCNFTSSEAHLLIHRFESWAGQIRRAAHPTPSHLPMLIKFNVWRALVSNTFTLGLTMEQTADDDALSPFTTNSPLIHSHLPAALIPTALQKRIPHHPWIDLLPFPRMRENLIRAGDAWDEEGLCGDMMGFFHQGTGREGVIVWGEPWDPRGWEASEEFLEYWGWAIEGCCEIVESTNYWRASRGEKPVRVLGMGSKRVNEILD